ncbi:type I-F CRISPR-associated endonuclease Cas1f [Amphibiibacter pelophylacis]|uniref:Type I-F CRISPR-associated endonuclease Cas1f n=1 Tax=Amphibiibacter pelophylacis TaxID=1799477 RepID=A0ACC6P1Y8_9BURK
MVSSRTKTADGRAMKIKSGRKEFKPKAILLSQRANILYLERARVVQKDGRVLYLQETKGDIDQFFNIPHQNTSLLLLGKGTSITDSAARQLADAGVVVGFTGSGATPLTCGIDPVFMAPQGEYRPTEYMQAWIRMWIDDDTRLEAGRQMLRQRCQWVQRTWSASRALVDRGVQVEDAAVARFEAGISKAATTDALMAAEGVWARYLYAELSKAFKIEGFVRQEQVGERVSLKDTVNAFLTHGNYVAYGLAAVALYALGISFALPVMHGKTRRGALVFDVADLFKDAIVMPLAFQEAAAGASDQHFRDALIERVQHDGVLEDVIANLQKIVASKVP